MSVYLDQLTKIRNVSRALPGKMLRPNRSLFAIPIIPRSVIFYYFLDPTRSRHFRRVGANSLKSKYRTLTHFSLFYRPEKMPVYLALRGEVSKMSTSDTRSLLAIFQTRIQRTNSQTRIEICGLIHFNFTYIPLHGSICGLVHFIFT